jgi:hypothetical protein
MAASTQTAHPRATGFQRRQDFGACQQPSRNPELFPTT